jgi:hypothetical protein
VIDPRYELLVRFAAYTGLRAGELVALRVRHLNLLRGRCEVGESATEVDGRLVWGPTKTCARRTVPLPRFLRERLAAYLAERPHGPDDLVFTAPQGGPLREQKFVAGIFKPAAARAGLPHRLRFHDLRHTCASLLIAQGASIKAVQAQLGHASATVTLDRYGHLFPTSSSSSPTGSRTPTPRPARTQHGPKPLRRCFDNAKRQVSDLPLLVEVGRLELPSRNVVPGLLRAQLPGHLGSGPSGSTTPRSQLTRCPRDDGEQPRRG